MVSSVTGFTPVDAEKKENQDVVKMNLESQRKHNKQYDKTNIHDRVRLYRRRRRIGEKEDVPIYSKQTYEVVKIDDNENAGKLYYLSNRPTIPILRSQILLVK